MSDGRGRLFGTVAELYDRFRPDPPGEFAAHLGELAGRRVLDVGAGTGKLTRFLLAHGARVSAVEPDDAMRAVLVARSPEVEAIAATAEALPFAEATFDLVASSSAWHWFSHPAAEHEFARVLKDDGRIVVAWNGLSGTVGWVRDLVARREREDDPDRRPRGWHADLSAGPYEDALDFDLAWVWRRSVEDLVALFATYSGALVRPEDERRELFDAVAAEAEARAVEGIVEVPMSLRGTTARRAAR